MQCITVTQLDSGGHYLGTAQAWESPLDAPGTYLMPAGTIRQPPPNTWPTGRWPRWNGVEWELVAQPAHIKTQVL
jgi:hypothetical protein